MNRYRFMKRLTALQLVYMRYFVHFFNVIMIINCEYKLSQSQVNHICVELRIVIKK
jgi:hypothetical protein